MKQRGRFRSVQVFSAQFFVFPSGPVSHRKSASPFCEAENTADDAIGLSRRPSRTRPPPRRRRRLFCPVKVNYPFLSFDGRRHFMVSHAVRTNRRGRPSSSSSSSPSLSFVRLTVQRLCFPPPSSKVSENGWNFLPSTPFLPSYLNPTIAAVRECSISVGGTAATASRRRRRRTSPWQRTIPLFFVLSRSSSPLFIPFLPESPSSARLGLLRCWRSLEKELLSLARCFVLVVRVGDLIRSDRRGAAF